MGWAQQREGIWEVLGRRHRDGLQIQSPGQQRAPYVVMGGVWWEGRGQAEPGLGRGRGSPPGSGGVLRTP